MDLEALWGEVHKRFDPTAPPAKPEWRADRTYGGVYALNERLRVPFDRHPKVLVAGTVGAGKTTELIRLGDMRGESDLTVYFDVHQHMADVVGEASALDSLASWELAVLVGLAVSQTMRVRLPTAWDDQQLKPLQDAWDALRSQDAPSVELGKLLGSLTLLASGLTDGSAALKPVAGALSAVRWNLPLGRRRKQTVREQDPRVQRVFEATNAILKTAEKWTGRRLVFLLDGLDRMTSRERAEALLVQSRLLSTLDCALIANAPFIMRHHAALAETRGFYAHLLVNEPVLSSETPANPETPGPGLRFFRDVFHKRTADLQQVHPVPLIEQTTLDRLGWLSGGRSRDFIQMVRESLGYAFLAKEATISLASVTKVTEHRRHLLESGIRQPHQAVLQRVLGDPHAPLPNDDIVDELLAYGRILPYQNGSEWFFPHPLLLTRFG